MTNDQVLDHARRKGVFSAPLHNAALVATCLELKDRGLLTGGRRQGGCAIYHPAKLTP